MTFTPILIDGAEHGVISIAGGGIFNSSFGTLANLTAQTIVKRSGSYAFRTLCSGSQIGADHDTGSPSSLWEGMFAYRRAATPSVKINIFQLQSSGDNGNGLFHLNTDNTISSRFWNGSGYVGTEIFSAAIPIDTWILVKFSMDFSGTTWVTKWEVDEVTQTDISAAGQVARTPQIINIGAFGGLNNSEGFHDDIIIGNGSVAEHPVDDMYVLPYSPNGVGTHNLDAATSAFFFKDIGGTETALTTSETTSHEQIDNVPLDGDIDHIFVRASGGGGGGTQTDLLPTAVEAASGYSSIPIADIDEDPDTPDGSWGTASGNNTATSVRVSFPTSTGAPDSSGTLVIAAYVRKGPSGSAGTGTPTARIDLYYNGALIASGTTQNITSLTGQKITQNFDLATVNNAGQLGDGSGLEVLIAGTQSGGSPSSRATVEVGAVDIQSLPYATPPTQPTNTWYTEHTIADSNELSAPIAVRAVIAMRQDAAANCSITAKLRANGNESNIYSGDINSATNIYKSATFTTAPGGAAWTDAIFDGSTLRWGYTNDADGTPRLVDAMLMAAFVTTVVPPTESSVLITKSVILDQAERSHFRARKF